MPTAEFSKFAGILSAALSQHHLPGFEIAQLEFLLLNNYKKEILNTVHNSFQEGEYGTF